MVLVGGATRLTELGLSITQWKPVTGVIPPLSAADWQAEFERYKQIPQYALLNPDMTLEGFKTIFWWEWSHRLLARIVGAAFILPGFGSGCAAQFKGALGRQVAVATGLLALEPIVGWWMVSSGLSERTEVAQERLALHLLIAAATFGALIYAAAGLSERKRAPALARLRHFGRGLRGAGLCPARPRRAGRGPARRAHLQHLAADGLELGFPARPSPRWLGSMLDDPATAQFDHRMFAYAVLAFALAQARRGAPRAPRALRLARRSSLASLRCKSGSGIATLLLSVPIPLALAHQATALALFGLAVWHWQATLSSAADN